MRQSHTNPFLSSGLPVLRPQALTGKDIFVNMERALGSEFYGRTGVPEDARMAARRIIPWLPSFSGDFTCAVRGALEPLPPPHLPPAPRPPSAAPPES